MNEDKFTPEQKRAYDLRHYPVRPHIGVGGVILWNDSVCIVKRKFNPNKGRWAIPGGHLRLGEPTAQGALRECIEETGLSLQVGEIASVIDKIDYDINGKIEYHYVLCNYWMYLLKSDGDTNFDSPPIISPNSDALDAKFVSRDELSSYDLTPTVIKLFRQLEILPSDHGLNVIQS